MQRRHLYLVPHILLTLLSHAAVPRTVSVSIDPLLPSKLITSKALLNSISVCQLAFLWRSGLPLTIALKRCSVWSHRWSLETWRGNCRDAGSPHSLDIYPQFLGPRLESKGGKKDGGLAPRWDGKQNLPGAVFLFLGGKAGKWKFRNLSSIWNIELCVYFILSLDLQELFSSKVK